MTPVEFHWNSSGMVERFFSGKCIKTKIKTCGDKVNTNFQGKKVPKQNAPYKCLSLIMLDSVIRANKKYYPQRLLEECKYEIKKN